MEPKIDVRDLRAVLAVAEHRSFARAAESLWVSRASMSEQIKSVERLLGVRLFDRTTRSVAPTPAGTLFVQHAVRLLAELDGLQDAVREAGQLTRGTVRLGVPPGVVPERAWHVLSAFHRDHPAVELAFTETSVDEILAALARRDLDLSIVAWPLGSPPTNVTSVEMGSEPTGVAVAADHPLALARRVSADDLRDLPLVTFRRGFVLRDIAEDFCERAGLAPAIALQSTADASVAGLVRAQLGFTVMPLRHARSEGLAVLATEVGCRDRVHGVAWSTRGTLDPVSALLRDRFLHGADQFGSTTPQLFTEAE